MNFTTFDIILVAVSAIGLLAIILQGVFIYKVAKSVNIKEKIDTNVVEEENPGDSLYERLKFKYRTDPKRFVKTSLFLTYFLFFIAIPGINTLHNKYMEEPDVSITGPSENQIVDTVFTVEGGLRNVEPGKEILWLALYSVEQNKYYLNNRSAEIKYETNKWQSKISIPKLIGSNGKKIKIVVMLIDKTTNAYEDIMNNISEEKGKPIDKLPSDCKIMEEINFITK